MPSLDSLFVKVKPNLLIGRQVHVSQLETPFSIANLTTRWKSTSKVANRVSTVARMDSEAAVLTRSLASRTSWIASPNSKVCVTARHAKGRVISQDEQYWAAKEEGCGQSQDFKLTYTDSTANGCGEECVRDGHVERDGDGNPCLASSGKEKVHLLHRPRTKAEYASCGCHLARTLRRSTSAIH